MASITIKVSDKDLEILKNEASKSQYELDEYLERFFSEAFRPIRGKYAKAEMEANKKKWGY
jgi:predicted DNA binding CopG/RHH family protein